MAGEHAEIAFAARQRDHVDGLREQLFFVQLLRQGGVGRRVDVHPRALADLCRELAQAFPTVELRLQPATEPRDRVTEPGEQLTMLPLMVEDEWNELDGQDAATLIRNGAPLLSPNASAPTPRK